MRSRDVERLARGRSADVEVPPWWVRRAAEQEPAAAGRRSRRCSTRRQRLPISFGQPGRARVAFRIDPGRVPWRQLGPGGGGVTTAVGVDCAGCPVPPALLATSCTRIVSPTSPVVSV